MRWVFFLSRLAFICNLFFLLALSLQFGKWFQNKDAESLVIIIGYFMSIMVSAAVNLCYLWLFWLKRPSLKIIPPWLRVANVAFLFVQLIYIFHLNG